MGFLGKFQGLIFAAMRIVVGLMFSIHGAQKLFGWFGGMGENGGSAPFLSLMFFAGLVELGGGLLVAVGFQTRLAAFIASGEMAVAYFMAHAPRGLDPVSNQGERAVMYCFVFLFIAAHGAGALGLDSIFGGKKDS